MVILETEGSGTANPAPAPAFGGTLFGAPKPAENKEAPKPGRHANLGLCILVSADCLP